MAAYVEECSWLCVSLGEMDHSLCFWYCAAVMWTYMARLGNWQCLQEHDTGHGFRGTNPSPTATRVGSLIQHQLPIHLTTPPSKSLPVIMPPKNSSTNTAQRKGPQFKPPRPTKAPTKPAAAKRAPVPASRSTGVAKKPAATTAKPGFQSATTIISSDDEQEDELDADSDDLMDVDAPPREARRPAIEAITAHPIPAPLLARLLHENFEDSNTQIQKGAMNLVGKYMEIFVREALARAKHERENSAKEGGVYDGFCQVEDLEKLAPQLVLDF
ncbi:hypothetical protein P153DRAFT_361004 [Dothidotthia symphoricarpi CBS 119687]|uniref:Uncharacterized protein n=1 Tax=Dothidotthia symphoricarpi CBS 119687 TaxID=1392245 RepID=A0A6A5ZZ45_9PLEO|nr:uncharacterized protein P153DRAFT_361004 [Dothidotthia symphoricarpi CBS 119687]KAF2124839.1 hypothetical protein P153DRAFT_361004 [Dothidotthia symphoricarpi CBS 119687]